MPSAAAWRQTVATCVGGVCASVVRRVPVAAFESASSITMGVDASLPATGEGVERSRERSERAELADVSRLSRDDR
eukprot:1907811-Pleurochrysis_carterae.AAC.2